MTTEISVIKPKRGQHPNSRANLKPPYEVGHKNPGPGGAQVSHFLKSILAKKDNAKKIAEKMVERSQILTGKSDSAILSQLLDRTEGRVQPDSAVNINNDNRSITIIVKSDEGKLALQQLTAGKLPQLSLSPKGTDADD